MELKGVTMKITDRIKRIPFNTTILFILIVLYYELIFHCYHFGMADSYLANAILFSVITGCFLSIFTNLFPRMINRILAVIFTCLLALIFIIQFLYHAVFNNYISFWGTLQYSRQAMDNFDTILLNIKQHAGMMILLVLPVIIIPVLVWRVFDFQKRTWRNSLLLTVATIGAYGGGIFLLSIQDNQPYNAYEMYQYYTSVDMTVERLGVCEALAVDLREGIADSLGRDNGLYLIQNSADQNTEKNSARTDTSLSGINTAAEAEHPAGVSSGISTKNNETEPLPNSMDIDFERIAAESGSEGVKSLCEYFSGLTPTCQNEYTGMFEGYNVIWITAEGFSGYALDSDLYPTLSMMAKEGFVFENYYSPLWYGSTLGGEYANLMGSMPKNGGYLSLSHAAQNGNSFVFSMGNQLKDQGYHTYAFHNNTYTYYDRNISHPALGYTFIANGSGLEPQLNQYDNVIWPQSDLVMIQDTFDTYSREEPYHLYYLTVSGHVIYDFSENAMSYKHIDVTEDLPYSETAKAYLACQYELELAVSKLVDELKENGQYENTLIVLAGDHVPYNNMDILDELAGYELEDTFEAYKSSLIIWSGSMEEPIYVDKVCSSIDILPTVSNLLGLEYDSRLIIGQDILSDSEGLVMFADRSFITDSFSYNSAKGEVLCTNGEAEISEEMLSEWKRYVANKFTAADGITEYNFYQYIDTEKK